LWERVREMGHPPLTPPIKEGEIGLTKVKLKLYTPVFDIKS